MKDTINKYQFIDWFRSSANYVNNFSYEGLEALFDYLEEFEEDTGTELEFDPVAFACEFSEYENLQELQENYGYDKDTWTLDFFRDRTTVIEIEGSERLIVSEF